MEMQDKVKIVSEPVVNTASGEPYLKIPVSNSSTAMRACLHMMLKHTADMFLTVVDIMAEKYSLDADEMMEVITTHPKYKDMYINPILHDLGYIVEKEASSAPLEEPVVVASTTAPVAAAPTKKWSEETKRKAAEKRAATKAAKAQEEVTAVATAPAPPNPLKMFKIKPKAVKPPAEEVNTQPQTE